MRTTDKKIKKKTLLHVRTRHPSHGILRRNPLLRTFGKRILLRLGSITQLNGIRPYNLEINSVDGIKNSSDKLKMKKCFDLAKVSHCFWYRFDLTSKTFLKNGVLNDDKKTLNDMFFPIIAKGRFGSRGNANTKIDNIEEFNTWLNGKDLSRYLFELYFNGAREYRLHVSKNGCFYTNRKLRKQDAEERWFFNNLNCAWMLETNPLFKKPDTWDAIVEDCVNALDAVGLDLGAFDVRTNKEGDWRIIEVNSAPSFGEITSEKYIQELNKIIQENK
jgi:hypothetical protein